MTISMILRLMRFSGERKKFVRQLHGQRGAALLLLARRHVAEYGLKQSPVIHAAVLKKAAVLDGQHRLHQVGRNLVVGHQPAFGAVGVVAQAGNQQRLQLIARQRLAMVVGDRFHPPAADANGRAILRVIRLRPGCTVMVCAVSSNSAQLRSLEAPSVV